MTLDVLSTNIQDQLIKRQSYSVETSSDRQIIARDTILIEFGVHLEKL